MMRCLTLLFSWRLSFLIVVSLGASGCFGGWRPNTNRYLLDPGVPSHYNSLSVARKTLIIGFVGVAPLAAKGGFVYRFAEDQWTSDLANRWAISVPEMFTQTLRTWMDKSGRFRSINIPNRTRNRTALLETYIDELYVDFRNPKQPEAILAAHLTVFSKAHPRQKLASRRFHARRPLASPSIQALLQAWNQALRDLLIETETLVVSTAQ